MATKRRKARRRTVTLGGMSQSEFAGSPMARKPKGNEPRPEEGEGGSGAAKRETDRKD